MNSLLYQQCMTMMMMMAKLLDVNWCDLDRRYKSLVCQLLQGYKIAYMVRHHHDYPHRRHKFDHLDSKRFSYLMLNRRSQTSIPLSTPSKWIAENTTEEKTEIKNRGKCKMKLRIILSIRFKRARVRHFQHELKAIQNQIEHSFHIFADTVELHR